MDSIAARTVTNKGQTTIPKAIRDRLRYKCSCDLATGTSFAKEHYSQQDDARQAAVAKKPMERSTSAGRPLFIPLVVLCELVWDLSRSHRQAKAEIVRLLEYLLEAKLFQVDPESLVRRDVPRDVSGVSRLHQFEVA